MKPIEYLFWQMELEGIQRTADHLISRRTPEVEDFPLALLAQTTDEDVLICYDDSLPLEMRARLRACDREAFGNGAMLQILAETGIQAKTESFRTYIFPTNFAFMFTKSVQCLPQDDPRVAAFGFQGLADQVFAVEYEGRVVSACVSARQNTRCGECWVLTDPDFRRQGFAQQVVTAWAGALLLEDRVPLYSHNVKNTASALLAQKMELIHVYDETVIERE